MQRKHEKHGKKQGKHEKHEKTHVKYEKRKEFKKKRVNEQLCVTVSELL